MYFLPIIFSFIITFLEINLYKSILTSYNISYYSHFKIFNFLLQDPFLWNITKIVFIITSIFSIIFLTLFWFSFFRIKKKKSIIQKYAPTFGILVGIDENDNKIYIPEKGLYQNILITGTIGSGKTSAALYPFTQQLMKYNSCNSDKLSFLILDVKGNYYLKVLEFAKEFHRLNDVIIIELRW